MHYHTQLTTALEHRQISVDEFTFLRFNDIKLNGQSLIRTPDIIGSDGVAHGLKAPLVPPKEVMTGVAADAEDTEFAWQDVTVEMMERWGKR